MGLTVMAGICIKAIEFKYGDKIIKDHVTLDDFYKNPNIWKEYYENSSIEIPFDRLVNSKKVVTIIEVGPDYSRDRYLLLTDRGAATPTGWRPQRMTMLSFHRCIISTRIIFIIF